MKRFLLWIPFFVVSGCSSGDQVQPEEIERLISQTEEAIGKAEDLTKVQEAFTSFDTGIKGIAAKIQKLPKDTQTSLGPKLEMAMQKGMPKVEAALEKFQERMLAAGGHPTVVIETSMGPIKVELYENLAPITVKNFLQYVDEQFYDGTIFHRVIPDFMIQGGGFLPGLKEKKTRDMIKNESFNGLANKRGTLAMARTSAPDSASSQFFISVKDNAFLDRIQAQDHVGYAVFAKVTEGMDVVDKIRNVKTADQGGHEKVPVTDVVIKSIRRAK